MSELIPGGVHTLHLVENIAISSNLDIPRYYSIFYYRSDVGYVYVTWDELGHQKTPEMSELEADKYAVKIWAHNSKNQKS